MFYVLWALKIKKKLKKNKKNDRLYYTHNPPPISKMLFPILGVLPQCNYTPTMSSYTYIYSHNVPPVNSPTPPPHTHTHTQSTDRLAQQLWDCIDFTANLNHLGSDHYLSLGGGSGWRILNFLQIFFLHPLPWTLKNFMSHLSSTKNIIFTNILTPPQKKKLCLLFMLKKEIHVPPWLPPSPLV